MSFSLPETVTVWNKSGNDGFGGITWGTPATHAARVANKQEQFRDSNGNLNISQSVVYSEAANISIGSMIFVGTSVDASPPATADEVKAISSVPSALLLRKFWL